MGLNTSFGIILTLSVGVFITSGCVPKNSIQPYKSSSTDVAVINQLAQEYCQIARNGSFPQPTRPFTTDGCSSWPDSLIFTERDWRVCCVVHDIPYWCGGTKNDRKKADSELKKCVNHSLALMGFTMKVGVRFGGHPVLPTRWRWGYGYENRIQYTDAKYDTDVKNILKSLNACKIVEQQLASTSKNKSCLCNSF